MPQFGPAARLLIEALAAAHAFQRPQATAHAVRALIGGRRLADLVEPQRRAECQAALTAVTARARHVFGAWAEKHGAPAAEIARGFDHFEVGAEARVAAVLPRLSAREDGEATVIAFFFETAEINPPFAEDVIVRDVGRALLKAAVAAARDYAPALARLAAPRAPSARA